MIFIFILLNLIKFSSSQCGHGEYDLSPLTLDIYNKEIPYQVDFIGSSTVYSMNVCGVMRADSKQCMLASMVQGSIATCFSKWESTSSVTYKYVNDDDNSAGLIMITNNGASCGINSPPGTVYYTFVCDKEQEHGSITMQQNTQDSCAYDVRFPTKYACVARIDKKKGLSGGSIFLIILLAVVLPIYIVAGCYYNHYKAKQAEQHLTWRERCPNNVFWFALPGLVKDGCLFTYRKIRACYNHLRGKNDGYDSM